MGTRYYFHLMDDSEILGDLLGVEVGELADVELAAIDILQEFRIQESHRRAELGGWRLAVTDPHGNCVILLPIFPT